MPKVSVIIPVYNAAAFLRQCLDSVRDQRLSDMEVLCIDAGCTDESPAILRQYAKTDPRFHVLSGYGRLDAGSARNIGLSEAKGDYLSFLDSDDFFHRDMLYDAWKKASADRSDIVIFKARQLDMRSGMVSDMPWSLRLGNCPRKSPFSPEEMAGTLFNSFENWTWNKLFRREFILEAGITFQAIARTNDMAFTCQALARAKRISCLNKCYVTYRIGTGTSLQQTNDRSPTCFWEAYRETRHRLMTDGVYETYRESFCKAVLLGTIYNLNSIQEEAVRNQVLSLVQQQSAQLGLLPEAFSHPRHQQWCSCLLSGKPIPPLSRRESLQAFLSDYGIGYAVKYAIQKIISRFIKQKWIS